MRRLEYLIYLFLFLLPWQTRLILRPGVLNDGNWEYGIIGIYGTEILLWLIILFFGLRGLLSGTRPFLFYRRGDESAAQKRNGHAPGFIIWCVFIILFILVLSASARLIAFQQSIHVIEIIAIFLLLTKLPINHFKAAYAFLAGLVLQAGLGIYQFLFQTTFASRWLGLTLHDAAVGGTSVLENSAGRWLRAYAGLPHPNIFGGYMAVGILIVAILLVNCHFGWKTRMALLSANGILFTGLFFSFSRSAWLGLAVSLAVFCFFNSRQFISNQNFRLFFLSSILLAAIFSLLYAPLLKNRILGEGRLEARTVEERVGGYGEAWELFKKHLFWGVGPGNYTLAVRDEIDSSRPAWDYQPAHNVFLLILAELGAVGVLIVLFAGYLIGFKTSRDLLPIFALFFILAIFDHYLWTLYSGLMLVGAGGGLLTVLYKNGRVLVTTRRINHVGNNQKTG